jgi:hypothetical protein
LAFDAVNGTLLVEYRGKKVTLSLREGHIAKAAEVIGTGVSPGTAPEAIIGNGGPIRDAREVLGADGRPCTLPPPLERGVDSFPLKTKKDS